MRDELLKRIQAEGLAIIKLHKRLEELNIEHEFIDRKEKSISLESDKKMCDIIGEIVPFYYQIYVVEDGKEISLIQSPYSYGITENLIEAYNFEHEPVVLDHEHAADLISKKKLNSYIIDFNEELEKIKEVRESLITKKINIEEDKNNG
jgi:hypothetical protein